MNRPAAAVAALPPMNLRDMVRRYGIRLKKGLGQNLLLDDNINRIMVEAAALSREDHVIEVGPGLGALTRRLVREAGMVLAVEIDASFVQCLNDQFGSMENFRLFRGDILNHSVAKLIEEYIPGGKRYKVVSNLPYYITTPILFHFLECPVNIERLVVMMQAEVGQRLVAPVNTEDYGVLGVAARLYAEVDIVHQVPASCFVPRPKVDSCIVRLRCRPKAGDNAEARFVMKVVRAAFSQRRKTLRNSLTQTGVFGAPKEAVLAAMAAAGIDPGRRPQTLTLEEFQLLAREIRLRL
jgi:16S rRNA (adenine1518-N6/adenine1519-N6)-dimethyltransferase